MDFGAIWDSIKSFFTLQEWIALVISMPIGILVTEPTKRYLRKYVIKPHQQKPWAWPLAAFVITWSVAFKLWPNDAAATFPYPEIAATVLAFGAPVIYSLFIAWLYKKGYNYVADVLTGKVTVKQVMKGESKNA